MAQKTMIPRKATLPTGFSAAGVDAMLHLLRLSPLPDKSPIDLPENEEWKLGMPLRVLRELKDTFEATWSYEDLLRRMRWDENYVVDIPTDNNDGDVLSLHFVHCRSNRKDAIPLLLLHGWPGTAFDFHKVIDALTSPPDETHPAFHVVAPSLPGFFISSLPQRGREGGSWTIVDTAHALQTLMSDVLGYHQYVSQAGDWGSHTLRVLSSLYAPKALPLTLFTLFHCPLANPSPSQDDIAQMTASERRAWALRLEFFAHGQGYFHLQKTKPLTIGYAMAASPLALLSYVGEKLYSWSDPARIDMTDLLDTVAIYYLSGCSASAALIYQQSDGIVMELGHEPVKWRVKSKIGYSAFPYEPVRVSRADIEGCSDGPVVFYKEHNHGGHFPSLDSSKEYIEDVREFFGAYWSQSL